MGRSGPCGSIGSRAQCRGAGRQRSRLIDNGRRGSRTPAARQDQSRHGCAGAATGGSGRRTSTGHGQRHAARRHLRRNRIGGSRHSRLRARRSGAAGLRAAARRAAAATFLAALDYCLSGRHRCCCAWGFRLRTRLGHRRAAHRGGEATRRQRHRGGRKLSPAPVQFPACSPQCDGPLERSARIGSHPEDSPQAFPGRGGEMPVSGGLFIPSFSCRGTGA